MSSIADGLREQTRRQTVALSADARIERALALGDDDARLFAATHDVPVDEARRTLARTRQIGRQSSRAAGRP